MRSRLLFDSKELFDPFPEDEGLEIGGKVAIDYLAAHLPDKGVKTGEIIQEDWGWVVEIDDPEFWMWVGCGIAGTTGFGLNCFVIPDKPRFWHWLGRQRKRDRIQAVKDAVEDVLRESGKAQDLHWVTEPY